MKKPTHCVICKDKGARLNVAVASGDIKSSEENLTSQTRVTVPHDVLTTDVLAFFQDQGRILDDVLTAPHGSMVRTKGTLLLIDHNMLKLAAMGLKVEAEAKRKAARTTQEKNEVQELKQIIPFLESLDLPSGFLLHTDEGLNIAGTVKEAGMEEPISTYYFKHGTAGLSSVYLVGIKEQPTHSFSLSNNQIVGVGQFAAQALRNIMFPPDATMVTPICLFRSL